MHDLHLNKNTMETKKSSKADLENKKNIFFEIGLLVAISVVFLAFEWKTVSVETSDFITVSWEPEEEIMVPITQNLSQPPPPPPALLTFNALDLVDETFLESDVELTDPEDISGNSSSSSSSSVQNGFDEYEIEETDEVIPFVPAEDMPQFNGDLKQWLKQNLNYPSIALDMNIQGKVFIQFVVEKDGSISNIKVMRGVDASLDQEAVRVIQSMPKWIPGKQRGRPVRVAYNMPITFELK